MPKSNVSSINKIAELPGNGRPGSAPRGLRALYDNGRRGTGCLSILPVEQGTERSADDPPFI